MGYPYSCRRLNDLAQTDIVAIVDSDDVLHPEATAELLDVFRKQKCVMAVTKFNGRTGFKDGCELINDQYEHIRA